MNINTSKEKSIVSRYMFDYAKRRCIIPNANNGRAFMSCVILDEKFRPLQGWL